MTGPAQNLLAGIDFGTGGCKITLIAFDGSVSGETSVEYPTFFEHPGWSEQNPDDWYAAMCLAFRKLRESGLDLRRVRAVAFDGSTHNAVLLDAAMRPVRRTIMWTDQRSTEECAFLEREYGEKIFACAYQRPAPTWTLPQLLWLKQHEPETFARARHILFVKDYVRYLVTGVAATDRIEAQGTLFFDMKARSWSYELAALAGVAPEMLPELAEPADILGCVSAQAAADTGLEAGIPVVCGASDSAVEDYGAGAVEEGDCIVKLATAGNVNVMTSAAHPDAATLTYSHVIPGMWYTVSATNAAALCQRWFRDTFCEDEKRAAQSGGPGAFERIDRLAAASPPGANGVFFHPYLQGERSPYWDSSLRGGFTGVSISSTRADFARAVLEGVAFSLLDCFGVIRRMALPVKRIFLIGGGAKSVLWSRIVCDVFSLPVRVPEPGDASFGSALLAGVGAGVFSDPRAAVNACLHCRCELRPDDAAAAVYAARFPHYLAIHDALAGVYRKLALSTLQPEKK